MAVSITITKTATISVDDKEVREYHDVSESFWNALDDEQRLELTIEYVSIEEGAGLEPCFDRNIEVAAQ